jgi:4'-phosphopantetheinyl transferase
MSLAVKQMVGCGTWLGVWKKEEDPGLLSEVFPLKPEELTDFERITNPARKTEWLIARILLTELAEKRVSVSYSEFGKPFLTDSSCYISISHSKTIVAAILSYKDLVGIDVEQMNHRAAKVRHKYLTEAEQQWCKTNFEHTVVWSAKESVFKIYEKELDFQQMEIERPVKEQETGNFIINVNKANPSKQFCCNYQVIEDNILTYVITPFLKD